MEDAIKTKEPNEKKIRWARDSETKMPCSILETWVVERTRCNVYPSPFKASSIASERESGYSRDTYLTSLSSMREREQNEQSSERCCETNKPTGRQA
jgi:hypothetical protein